jgi:peptidoglycan/xylan/chitin deacetylase (PgdA/CDA1 family)
MALMLSSGPRWFDVIFDETAEDAQRSNDSLGHAERFDNTSLPMNLRHTAFAAAFRAITLTGADRWARGLGQGVGAILMLHHVRPWAGLRFAPNRLLEVTPDWLADALQLVRDEGYDLVGMDEMAARITGPKRDRFAVALTFDDGYRDNVEYALPVLQRFAAPWTLYVTTGYADHSASLWWIEFEHAIRLLDQVTLIIGGRIHDHDTRSPEGKQGAFDDIYWALRARPEAELRAAVTRLAAQAGLEGPALTRELCLGWDELRALKQEPSLTFGAHTMTHPMLAKQPVHVAQPEIVEAKYRIEFELGVRVDHLAYPVGDAGSAGPREFELARAASFSTAVTTRPGHVFAAHADHLQALPRVSLNGFHQNRAALRALLCGLPFLALNRGCKLDVG